MTNKTHRVLYIGITNDLARRVYQHKNKEIEGFTARYNVDKLVYFEITTDVNAAIEREKVLKKWSRKKKEWLIALNNPLWEEISVD